MFNVVFSLVWPNDLQGIASYVKFTTAYDRDSDIEVDMGLR